MTKQDAKYLKDQVEKNCTHIRRVRRKHIVFTSRYWALEAYRYIFQDDRLFKLAGGMYMVGGDQIIYFPWR